ncbi:thioesterase II family protein [Streptomyces sp. ME19-01-6]|uniref:thioesterase II family protein n=1 Tax=Streptomyces sp. ME19-01-6 TaxID=3028686 RepID=UPI0029A3B7D8|nr:alpha/beta fold hydrolase [Streptomyces sp. ME19-01-6]MDX3225292.1 alpha/beta fold hydrolase [Streptomyces sp. ME19-01-6]
MTARPTPPHLVLGAADAPRRAVLLHYAGGSATSMLPLARALPDTCAVVLLELHDRTNPANTFAEAVARLRPGFEELLDRPTVVFGHSMGALMAHALVETLPNDRRRRVTALVLSGSRSPATTRELATFPPAAFTTRSRAELTHDMDRYGGCPPEVFTQPRLLDLAVTALGHDMQLIDTYPGQAGHGGRHTDAAYHVWYGADDDEASAHEARLWAQDLPRSPNLRAFPGGHFYLLEHAEAGHALRRLVDA